MDDEQGGGQVEQEPGSGILHVFGRQLKRFRECTEYDRAAFGSATGYSASTIASYEQGRRVPSPRFIEQADELLGARGVLVEMKEEVARAQYPPFFRDAAKLEAEAVELHVYANQAVPGLLQTEQYARAVFVNWRPLYDEETVEQRVVARLARQEILAGRPLPTFSFVIEEAVLGRPLGGAGVMRGQLEQILLVGQQRNVEVQIMPTKREEHAGLAGPFTLIETTEGRRIAYVEVHKLSRLYTERRAVREIEEQYGLLRAQALTPRESLALIEKLLGET
ncbi:helix-turn-helix domain-containing protein [Streptomyces lunaelactis]|uniref:helix-turn-helix domain-containing protein n=1 Tax=Streptomyces lunaelactis TaxID=1535768 RepID=UPI0015851C3E|nr:helix-turn-helix transcriptional regulator [Streptomyces lunaelactis]NUK10308.1 helix-turn-helix domain-containing protein [Streptomyces lunaelactis]NUK36966.1 helix-turn-helix domain-containing protein [Streptomyces lunaelactis]NUK44823.1 helix-turn-helix domain-containing protein [Streptomyces lunaelactis]NUK60188.1 helix-turn-helix domain-containing protein [Streptomyces lunaelactis]NUK95387.1 helix-turn-helix domain-containing protein [Streptomyces lunaelactis]